MAYNRFAVDDSNSKYSKFTFVTLFLLRNGFAQYKACFLKAQQFFS